MVPLGRLYRCSAADCNYKRPARNGAVQPVGWRTLRHFPKSPEICLAWIQASGNPVLANITVPKLSRDYYLCNAHFEASDGANERFLKPGAVPKIFTHNSPLSRDTLLAFARTNNLDESYICTPTINLLLPATTLPGAFQSKEAVCQDISEVTSPCSEDSMETNNAVNNRVEVFVQPDIDNSGWSNLCQQESQSSDSHEAFNWSDKVQIAECDDNAVILLDANDKTDKEVEANVPAKWEHCKKYQRKKSKLSKEQVHLNNHVTMLNLKKKSALVSHITLQNNSTPTETGDPMSRLLNVDKTRSLMTQEYVSSVLSALDADLSYSVFDRETKMEAYKIATSAPLSPRQRCSDEPSPEQKPVREKGKFTQQERCSDEPSPGQEPVREEGNFTQPTPATVTVPLQHIVEHIQQHYLSLPPPLVPINQGTSEMNVVRLPELRIENPRSLQSTDPQIIQIVSPETVEELLESSPDMDVEESVSCSSLPRNLCRVCAKACTRLEHFFSKKGEDLHLADLVHNHLPIMVTPDDLLPTLICTTCISRLQASESLVHTCIEADSTLRALLDLPQNTEVQLTKTDSDDYGSEDMDDHGREDNIFAQEDDFDDTQSLEKDDEKNGKDDDNKVCFSSLLSQEDMSMINKIKGDGLKVTLVRVRNLNDLPEEKKHQRVLQVLRTMNMDKYAKKKAANTICHTANISPVDDVLQDISAGSALRDKEVTDTPTREEPQPDLEPSIFNLADVDPPLIDLTTNELSTDLTTDPSGDAAKSEQPSSTLAAPNISVSTDVPSMLRAELLDGINYAIKQGHVAKTGSIIKLNCKPDDASAPPSSVYVYVRNKDTQVAPKQIPRRILDLDILHQHKLLQQEVQEKKAAARAAKHQASIARRKARVREKRRAVSERRALTCEECGFVFETKEEVAEHRMEHLKCRYCNKQFTRKPSLVEHERVHTKEKPFVCDQCGKAFRTRTQMVQHAQIHNTDSLYVCQVCGREFSVRKTYLAHVDSHSAESPFLCETCGKCFKVQAALRLHRLTHRSFNCNLCNKDFSYRAYQIHKKSHAGDESKYPCSYCNKKFLTSHRLKIHLLIHEAIYPFSCSVCKRSFKRMTHLQAHQARHTHEQLEGVAFFCCAICQVQYEFPGQLSHHIKTHSEEERQLLQSFKCYTCNKCFSIERELRSHELRHSGKQTFSCGTCNVAFDTKKEFDEHSDTHTEEKPFACDVCGKRFRALINLNNHQQTHLSFKPYLCQFCPKAFKTVNGLNQHKVVHSEERKHTCGICSMGFKRRDAMKNHERTHFAERPYACSVCGRAFKVKADCSTHLKRHREAGIEGSIMESCYTCPVCSANFSLKVELTTHVRNAHDMEVAVLDKDDNLVQVPDVDMY